ncbi:mobilization protein, partial [Bacteroides xylanisolvens]
MENRKATEAGQDVTMQKEELNSTCKCNRILINNLFKF